MRRQVLRHQDFHAVLLDAPVTGKVLPANVGTDRYLSDRAGSTRDAHQVNRGPTALLLDMGQGIIGHGYFQFVYLRNLPTQKFASGSTWSYVYDAGY
jgi:hypothetical protein